MKVNMAVLKTLVTQALDGYMPDDAYVNGLHAESTKLVGHPQAYYPLFYLIAKTFKPAFSLELGSWRGYASAHLAAGNPQGQVATIDIHKDDPLAQQICLEVQRRLGNFRYFHAWTWDAPPLLLEHYGNLKIDLLFIDAWHTYEYAMREWNLYKPYLAPEALVICDDLFNAAGACDKMEEFWAEVTQDSGVEDTFVNAGVHPGIPMGFARVKNANVR